MGLGPGVNSHSGMCTGKTIRGVFAEAEMPEEGTDCVPDVRAWELERALAGLRALVGESVGRGLQEEERVRKRPETLLRERGMEDEDGDVRLYEAMRGSGMRERMVGERKLL